MEISGRVLAQRIQEELVKDINMLKKRGVKPKLAIVTLGPENSWIAYVSQKIKLGKKLGVDTMVINLTPATESDLLDTIKKLNIDRSVHGIIVQRPMPIQINKENIVNAIDFEKDVDGFKINSKYKVPAWLAVEEIIKQALRVPTEAKLRNSLLNQAILILGKGETAGMPVIRELRSLGLTPIIVDSKTKNKNELLKHADIIITAVGKRVVQKENLKSGVILIGIGIQREDGKLIGDYDENDIKDIVSFYTPTPGGVGPLNLSYLFKNLVVAAKNQTT